jgi:Tuberculosis necrotizing toxin
MSEACRLNYNDDCTLNWNESKICWPENSGCEGNEIKVRLVPITSHEKGDNVIRTLLDRFGFDTGNFFSDAGAAWKERSLPYFNNKGNCEKKFNDYVKDGKAMYKQYIILKPFDAYMCEIKKDFGAKGGAIQYRTELTAKQLVEQGFIKEYKYPNYTFGKKRRAVSSSLDSEIRYLRSI